MIGTTDYISIKLTDETQFRSIFDKYYISLCMFANQYVENDALAADIVQECFVKLWQFFNGIHQYPVTFFCNDLVLKKRVFTHFLHEP